MNRPEKILLFLLILWGAAAAETNERSLELQHREKTTELKEIAVQYQQLTGQAGSLALKISKLKSKAELNYFQRRELENYLKTSQKIAAQIETLNRRIFQLRHELQGIREQLVTIYDRQLSQLLAESAKTNLTKSRKNDLLKQISQIRHQRNGLQVQQDWEITESSQLSRIEIEASDTPRKIQVKADWLCDLKNRLRTNAAKIDKIVLNLKEEIELRDKMQEFGQELALFDHRDEARLPQVAPTETPTDVFGEERGGPPEVTTKSTSSTENASSLPLFPEIFENDFLNLSTADLQTVIDSLSRRKLEFLVTADSLNRKAALFYQKAEQAKSSGLQEIK